MLTCLGWIQKSHLVCILKLGLKEPRWHMDPSHLGRSLGNGRRDWILKRHFKCYGILPRANPGSLETLSLSFADIINLGGSHLNSLSLCLLCRAICPCIYLFTQSIIPSISIYWECMMCQSHAMCYDMPWGCNLVRSSPRFWGTFALEGE